MRAALLLSFVFALAARPALHAEPKAKPKTSPAAAEVVKALELERFQAAEKNDLDTLGTLLADDLTYTHSTGVLET